MEQRETRISQPLFFAIQESKIGRRLRLTETFAPISPLPLARPLLGREMTSKPEFRQESKL